MVDCLRVSIRKIVQRVVLITASLAAALLITLGIAHLPPVRARVLDQVRTYAARELGVAVDAKSLHYNLFGPSAELRDVTLASLDDKDRRALLRAESIRLTLGRSLILGQVEITRLELHRPRLTVVRDANGALNLPRGRGASSTDVTPLRLGRVELRQLMIGVDDEMSGRSFAMGPIDLAIDSSSPATNAPGAFGPSPFTIRLDAQPSDASPTRLSGTVAGRLAFDGTRVFVPALTIETPEGQIALDGSIDVIARAPKVDVRSRVRIDLARAARLAGFDRERLSGTLNANASATGLLSAPAVRLGLQGRGLAVRSFRDITLAADAVVNAGRLEMSAIDLRSPLGAVHVSGDIALADAGAPADNGATSRLLLRWTDVDLDAVARSIGYELPIRLGSRGSVTVSYTHLTLPTILRV